MKLNKDGLVIQSDFEELQFDDDGPLFRYRDSYSSPVKILELIGKQLKHISKASSDPFARAKARIALTTYVEPTVELWRNTKGVKS